MRQRTFAWMTERWGSAMAPGVKRFQVWLSSQTYKETTVPVRQLTKESGILRRTLERYLRVLRLAGLVETHRMPRGLRISVRVPASQVPMSASKLADLLPIS